ncbi:MAG TPA: M20/M25/M40 family metallo-hydrolase [Pyrinomonadaceae bacterium]|nr:M20/M25/M40 family metallo-hydrolase [Pyrinomonadaceae bacterium]
MNTLKNMGARAALAALLLFVPAAAQKPAESPKVSARAALDGVTADSLRGHLSFLASDLLEGRRTPSRGLDLAAEYVAAQFRRAGLEPAGDDGYFQTAAWGDVAKLSRRPRTLTPEEAAVKVRNVAGILRGSDPKLKDEFVIVSAHYDHLGVRPDGEGDRVFNGANDDASGTAGVIETAAALAKMNPRPRRSVLFLAFCAEEHGLLGSQWYGQHPLVPLARTVAQLNLEVIGRTDGEEGPHAGTLAMTGFDYSDVGALLTKAGEATGVRVYKHPTNSDAFFNRSDNQSLADAGVPAHTVSVGYLYPDYHKAGDEWQKLDYANMERVVRAVALAVVNLADAPQPPRWNEQNPKAARYLEAWKKLHGK